jgi:acyl-CoA reductase-like NAD-dependent aldehyde dehydrogenase
MSAFGPKVQADGASVLPLWIDGHAYLAMADHFFDVTGADGNTLRRVPLCGEEAVRVALDSAAAGLARWRGFSAEQREACFVELHALLERYRGHIANLVAEEAQLSHELAEAELAAALAGVSGIVAGPAGGAGIAVIIGDATAPLAGPAACAVEALAAGWVVIFKPSPRAPSALFALAEIFTRAGFPPGAVNLVQGDEAAVAAFCAGDTVGALAFAGSDAVAGKVRAIAAAAGQTLVGGMPDDSLLAAWRRQLGVND